MDFILADENERSKTLCLFCSLLKMSHPCMFFALLTPSINIFFLLTNGEVGIETCDDV